MLTRKVRCFVVRIAEDDSPVPPRAAWREALPWADPYILGLIRKLQDEVRGERGARCMSRREAAEMADDGREGVEVEYSGALYSPAAYLAGVVEPEAASPYPAPATAAAPSGAPPIHRVRTESTADDEGEWATPPEHQRAVRRPR